MAKRKQNPDEVAPVAGKDYDGLVTGLSGLLDQARSTAARVVNGVMTATYYELGRRIVEFEQGGKQRAEYGEGLLKRLGSDLSLRYGRGFSRRNLEQMRVFYLDWELAQVPSGALQIRARPDIDAKAQTLSAISVPIVTTETFPLPWSHYVRLMTVANRNARQFYEEEAIKGGWSVRQLDRQISTQFYERLSGSKRKSELLAKAQVSQPGDLVQASDLVRDPYVLEFLNLTDEYGESEL